MLHFCMSCFELSSYFSKLLMVFESLLRASEWFYLKNAASPIYCFSVDLGVAPIETDALVI